MSSEFLPPEDKETLSKEIELLHQEAIKAFTKGSTEVAIEILEKGVEKSVKRGLIYDTMFMYRSLSAIHDQLGQYPKALEYCEKGLKEAQIDIISSADLLINKGVIEIKMRKFKEAIQSFSSAANNISMVPPLLRTSQMHGMRDMAFNNRDLVKKILEAESQGKVIEIKTE